MSTARAYYDADGHVIELDSDIQEFYEEPYAGILTRPLPSLDRFHTPNIASTARQPGTFEPADAKKWLEFLDKANIEWSVLYPTAGLAYGRVIYPEWATAYARAYNNWLHQKFTSVSPRLKGTALIPFQDVPNAVLELRRAVSELGFAAAMIPSNGLNSHISDRKYWPIYEEAEKLDCALAVHGGNYDDLGFNTFTVFPATRSLGMPFPLAIAFTGMVVDGVLDAYPDLRVAFLEGGTAWAPLVIDRLRREREYGGLNISKDPEEYFHEGRIFVGCEGNEESLTYAITRIGYQSVVFASDFPHEISMDNCMEEIDEILERNDLEEAHKQAILGENARRLYKA